MSCRYLIVTHDTNTYHEQKNAFKLGYCNVYLALGSFMYIWILRKRYATYLMSEYIKICSIYINWGQCIEYNVFFFALLDDLGNNAKHGGTLEIGKHTLKNGSLVARVSEVLRTPTPLKTILNRMEEKIDKQTKYVTCYKECDYNVLNYVDLDSIFENYECIARCMRRQWCFTSYTL